MSKEAFRRAYAEMANQMDEIESRCVEAAEKAERGEELTDTERYRLKIWDLAGRKRWRNTPRLQVRIRRAAKMAARNERRKRRG